MKYIKVENISCDRCGYYDSAENFPDIYTPRSIDILKKFGLDINDPSDRGWIQSAYAGVICSICGNFSEFDFDRDNNMHERIVECAALAV
jgi:hypothetical protein